MKKRNVLALIMAGTLIMAGCGKSKNEETEPAEETTVSEEQETETMAQDNEPETEIVTEKPQPENKEEANPAGEIKEEPKTVNLADCKKQITSKVSLSDVTDYEKDMLSDLYGIDVSKVKQSAVFVAASDIAFPQEVVMVEAASSAAAADIASKLKARLAAIAEQASSYDPDSEALAKACSVTVNGNYVAMFFADKHGTMESIFNSCTK